MREKQDRREIDIVRLALLPRSCSPLRGVFQSDPGKANTATAGVGPSCVLLSSTVPASLQVSARVFVRGLVVREQFGKAAKKMTRENKTGCGSWTLSSEPPPSNAAPFYLLVLFPGVLLGYLEEMKASLVYLPALASCASAFVLHTPPAAVGPAASSATATRAAAPKTGRLAEADATCTRRRCERDRGGVGAGE